MFDAQSLRRLFVNGDAVTQTRKRSKRSREAKKKEERISIDADKKAKKRKKKKYAKEEANRDWVPIRRTKVSVLSDV